MKKYFIKTYGCQMNEHDSETISWTLENLGYESTSLLEDADVFVINSCSVRQAAEDSVYGLGKRIKNLSRKPFVILAGCFSGSAKGERARITEKYIRDKAPWIDAMLAPSEIVNLSKILPNNPNISKISNPAFNGLSKKHAYITISTGCDNFCSYCVVPYARKEEVSRPKEEIINEIKNLVKKGVNEFTLLGQNVNSWGLLKEEKFTIRTGSSKKLPFAGLIREICDIPEVKKVGFLSSNPFDFTEDLIDAVRHPKVFRYLHIALQSGDDDVLKKMNRRHTAKEYLHLINKIRKSVPDVKIGTDLIVGFPGETEAQFKNTVNLCKKIKFAKAYVAMYSPRPGTTAYFMIDDVPLEVKRRRHSKLLGVIKKITRNN